MTEPSRDIHLPVQTYGTDADFLALGFTFGEPDPDDPLFRPATLPEGWTLRTTDQAMKSEIVDQYGRKRVDVFYRPASAMADMDLETPRSYLYSVLYDGTQPVLDDEWLTLAVAQSTLEAIAADEDRQAAHADRDAAWSRLVADHRAEAAKARALAESLGGAS